MVMGGMGSFTMGRQWAPATSATNKGCFSYGHSFANTSHKESVAYRWIVGNITRHPEISVSVYTQTMDTEDECDGFLNYDRTKKMSRPDEELIKAANLRLIGPPKKARVG